ncbi:hypothetical protein FEF34_17580 [Streptomyces marianii]|uniref:Uncharacterized protein n=1 Tax=Streptomyces marianii TaxID=1817406 RepID=A0A5R9E9I7_9ACTN|nr:hypothetical protein FEF34_17580 [Streptomyces marianii]
MCGLRCRGCSGPCAACGSRAAASALRVPGTSVPGHVRPAVPGLFRAMCGLRLPGLSRAFGPGAAPAVSPLGRPSPRLSRGTPRC